MYKIIGIDQKEYGPIDAGQLRQWITQGRAYAQNLVKLEGTSQWKALNEFPEFAALNLMPAPGQSAMRSNDTISTIIPYKNSPALIAYYFGVFSIIPFIGFFLGIAGFVLGVMGLRRASRHPEAKGKVHAWIGIIAGGFFGLLYLVLIIFVVIGIAKHG
jgi:GYF domain 2